MTKKISFYLGLTGKNGGKREFFIGDSDVPAVVATTALLYSTPDNTKKFVQPRQVQAIESVRARHKSNETIEAAKSLGEVLGLNLKRKFVESRSTRPRLILKTSE